MTMDESNHPGKTGPQTGIQELPSFPLVQGNESTADEESAMEKEVYWRYPVAALLSAFMLCLGISWAWRLSPFEQINVAPLLVVWLGSGLFLAIYGFIGALSYCNR